MGKRFIVTLTIPGAVPHTIEANEVDRVGQQAGDGHKDASAGGGSAMVTRKEDLPIIGLLPSSLKKRLEKPGLNDVTLQDFHIVGQQLEKFKDKDPLAFTKKTTMRLEAIPPAHTQFWRVSLSKAKKVGKIIGILPAELKQPLQKSRLKVITLHDYLVLYSQLAKYAESDPEFGERIKLPTFGGVSGIFPSPVRLVIDP